MDIQSILLGVFLVLVSISQYFAKWVIFNKTGLLVIGIVGLVAGILYVLSGVGRPVKL